MADKSKKNIYRKTMGFDHNRVKTTVEMVTNATKGLIADVQHGIQQYGSNKNRYIGWKEPHKRISDKNWGTFKRPPYKKDKFKGAKDGWEKNSLGSYGNADDPEYFTMVGRARRKLVKGT